MEQIKTIAEFFLISLALSYTLFSPVANSSLTGNGFIKLISNLSIGSMVIALATNIISGGQFLELSNVLKMISIVALILVSVFHQDKKSPLMWALYGIITFVLGWHLLILSKGNFISFSYLIGSTFLLGIITYAMTLGHWYLVVPKLSEKPLLIAAKITWIVLVVKVLISTYSIFKNTDFFSEQTTLGSGYAFNWMLLLMRVLFGYVVIVGMNFFNWRLVKMRSIQSSTGILYAMTFFVFIGELISCFMFFNYGLLI